MFSNTLILPKLSEMKRECLGKHLTMRVLGRLNIKKKSSQFKSENQHRIRQRSNHKVRKILDNSKKAPR